MHLGADGTVQVTRLNTYRARSASAERPRPAGALPARPGGICTRRSSRSRLPAIAVEQEVPILVTVLYTAWHIWMARAMVIGVTIFFLVLIGIAWRRRASTAAAEATA